MDLHSAYPYFLLKNGYLYTYPSLSENIKTDVLIVGAGVCGALTGYYLMNSGVDVVIVDKRHAVTGSTCASSALLLYELDTNLSELADKIGFNNAADCYQLCIDAIYKLKGIAEKLSIDCDFQEQKSIYTTSQKKDVALLEKEYQARKKAGIKLDYLQASEVKQLTGVGEAYGALLSYDAAQMDAFRFTHGVLQHFEQKGGKIYSNTEIKKVTTTKQGIRFTTANGFTIEANKCIYSTGYEALQQISPPLTKIYSTYLTVSEPGDYPIDYLLWETARPYLYVRTTADRRLMIGGMDEKFYDPQKRDRLINKKTEALIKAFNKLYPHLLLKPDFSWAGTFAVTEDGLPFIGEHKKYPHSFFTLGFGGNGITFALIAAEIIHDLFHRKANKHAELFSFHR